MFFCFCFSACPLPIPARRSTPGVQSGREAVPRKQPAFTPSPIARSANPANLSVGEGFKSSIALSHKWGGENSARLFERGLRGGFSFNRWRGFARRFDAIRNGNGRWRVPVYRRGCGGHGRCRGHAGIRRQTVEIKFGLRGGSGRRGDVIAGRIHFFVQMIAIRDCRCALVTAAAAASAATATAAAGGVAGFVIAGCGVLRGGFCRCLIGGLGRRLLCAGFNRS